MTATLSPAQEAARMVDSLGPEALARAEAYTTGNHWLLLGGVLVSVLVSLIVVSDPEGCRDVRAELHVCSPVLNGPDIQGRERGPRAIHSRAA